MGKNKPRNNFTPILKKNNYNRPLIPLKNLKVKDLDLRLTPSDKISKVYDCFVKAIVSSLGYNPITNYCVSKELPIEKIEFDPGVNLKHLQKISIPLDNKIVKSFIDCPKYVVKSKNIRHTPNIKNRETILTEEERILLIGKLPSGEIVPFQMNFVFEPEIKGKKKFYKTSTNFGVILNGKNYVVCERYDESPSHKNVFYDSNKKFTEINQQKLINAPAHLHYTNKRVTISLFDILKNMGYSEKDIISSQLLSKQDAIPFRKFWTTSKCKEFFLEKYNINTSFEKDYNPAMTVKSFIDFCEGKSENITHNIEETLNDIPTKRVFYYEDPKKASREDYEFIKNFRNTKPSKSNVEREF